MSEQPLISGRGTCWKDKRSPNTYRYYFSLGVKDPKTGRYKRSPTYTVRCKTKTEAKAAMQAKLAEINSSGTITKTKKPTLLASYCWAFHENRDTELAPTSYEREAYDCRHIENLFGAFQTIEGLTPDLRSICRSSSYGKIQTIRACTNQFETASDSVECSRKENN